MTSVLITKDYTFVVFIRVNVNQTSMVWEMVKVTDLLLATNTNHIILTLLGYYCGAKDGYEAKFWDCCGNEDINSRGCCYSFHCGYS